MSVTQTDFYVTGGTMKGHAPSYVHRQADEDLYAGLMAGRFCYVLTSRQMGKSSLMVRAAERLRAEGLAVVGLDLTGLGRNLTAEQWYNGLLGDVRRQLDPNRLGLDADLKKFWGEHAHVGPLQRWMRAIREVVLEKLDGRLVIFVDEIDCVRSLPFSTDEFFAGIREFYNRRVQDLELERLTFCLLGVATPSDLIRDTRTTPFNIGTRIELADFSEAEVAPLIQGLGRGEASGTRLLKRILHWTGGHPYLTQRLCLAVAEDAGINGEGMIDRKCRELFFSSRAQENDENLFFVRERILRSDDVDRASLLDLYQKIRNGKHVVDDESNLLVSTLRLSGITRAVGGILRVRNRIYHSAFDKAWISASMPGAEAQRQRAAYRKGLMRAAAIATVIILALAGLAMAAVHQRDIAQQEREHAQQERERAEAALARAKNSEARLIRESEEKEQARASAEEASARATLETRRTKDALGVAEVQRRKAEAQTKIASDERTEAEAQRHEAEEQRAQALAFSGELVKAVESNSRMLYAANMNLAQQAWERGDTKRLEALLISMRPDPGKEDLRGFEWFYLWRLAHSEVSTLSGAGLGQRVNKIVVSPDGRRVIALGDSSYTAVVIDVETGREQLTLRGHAGPILSAAFSADGRRIATGSNDRTAKVWDAETGHDLMTFKGHTGSVIGVAISADGGRLLTGGGVIGNGRGMLNAPLVWEDTARVWDVASGRELLSLDKLSGINDAFTHLGELAISPDGKRAVVCVGDAIEVWDVASKQKLSVFKAHANPFIKGVSFSPDGQRVVSGGVDGTARVWEAQSGRELQVLRGHIAPYPFVNGVAFSPDGSRVVTAGSDKTARVWDAETGKELLTFRGHETSVQTVAFSSDGMRLITGAEDGTVKVWGAQMDQEKFTLREQRGTVSSAAFSPDGSRVVTGGSDDTARVWDAETGRPLLTIKNQGVSIIGVTISPDGHRIATGSNEGVARIWNAETGEMLLKIDVGRGFVGLMSFSHDGRLLVISGFNNPVTILDAVTGRPLLKLPVASHCAVFSPDGRRLLTGSIEDLAIKDDTAKVWDAATGKELFTLRGHSGFVYYGAFSPDGRRIVTGSRDHTAKLWDAETGHELLTLKGHTGTVASATFSSDGGRILTGGGDDILTKSRDDTARVWDAATGRELLALRSDAGTAGVAAFSPNGRRIITGGSDSIARIWDGDSGDELLRLEGHIKAIQATIYNAAFSPDGRHIVTANEDNSATVRDAVTGEVEVRFREHGSPVKAASFSPDGRRVASVGADDMLRVWDAKTGRELLKFPGGFSAPAFSPDGRLLAAGLSGCSSLLVQCDSSVKVWDANSGQEILTFVGHKSEITRLVFAPDSRHFATASLDGTTKVWDATNGRELLMLLGRSGWVSSIAYSPDGTRIAMVGGDGTVSVWGSSKGELLLLITGHNESGGVVAFSPDGRRIVTCGDDFTAKVWDVVNGQELMTLKGHAKPILSIAFSRGGDRLITAGSDGTANIWDAQAPKAVSVAAKPRPSAAEDFEAVIATSTEAIKADPRNWINYMRRGNVYLQAGQFDSAISDFKHAAQLSPSETLPQAYYMIGVASASKKDYRGAIDAFTQLAAVSPQKAWALSLRGLVYLQVRDLDAAIRDCSEAVESVPTNVNARLCRALALQQKGDLDAAELDYVQLLKTTPENAVAHYNLACIYSLRSGSNSKDLPEKQRKAYVDLALENLKRAIQEGFQDWSHIKEDPDLNPVRTDLRYLQMIKDH